jgi:hypothetical protein
MAEVSRTRPLPFAGPEVAKLLASFGIVMFHQHVPGERIGYAGLPVFTLLTAAFAARSAKGRDWGDYRAGRLRRLLLPWLAWSAFYVGVQCALAAYAGLPLLSWFTVSMLAMGTYPTLWYLPFAAVATLSIGRFGANGSSRAWLLVGMLAVPLASLLMRLEPPLPAPQWLFVAPAAILGVALARAPLGGGATRELGAFVMAGTAGLAVAWACGLDALLLQYALGVPLAAVAWAAPTTAPRWLVAAGAATFGVYVLHPFVTMMLALLSLHASVPFTEGTLLAAIWVGSMSLTMVLRATPVRALL